MHDEPAEHERWRRYRDKLTAGADLEALKLELTAEPDAALATSVVLLALEHRPPSEWEGWVALLRNEPGRAYARRRQHEQTVLRTLPDAPNSAVVDTWSDWLQLRVATECTQPVLLNLLASSGRTKRIRRQAAEALRRSELM